MPTFVLSAILALVVAVSVYFGQDPDPAPVPENPGARTEQLAGESSKPGRDDASRQNP